MNDPRKFYRIKNRVMEQSFDEPDVEIDRDVLRVVSRVMAELIASLLTKHFLDEAKSIRAKRSGRR